MTTNHTPTLPGFDPALTLTVARNGKDIYTIHGMPPFRASALAVAMTQHDALTARVAELEAALREVLDDCEDRQDIDGNGNPNTCMRYASILRAALAKRQA